MVLSLVFAAAIAMSVPTEAPVPTAANASIVRPTLVTAPDGPTVRKAYPPKALADQKDGSAVLHCRVSLSGTLVDCTADQDTPADYGFGDAALKLARAFKLSPQTENGKPVDTGRVSFRVRFEAPPVEPSVLKRATEDQLQAVWPARLGAMSNGGQGTLVCQVTVRGTLEACIAVDETPKGSGFGAAAVALAPQFLLKPAMKNGLPVAYDGYPVRIKWEPDHDKWIGYANIANIGPYLTIKAYQVLPMISAPTQLDVAKVYPQRPAAEKQAGKVVLRCFIRKDGHLNGCRNGAENPKDVGFRQAAWSLVPKFEIDLKAAPPKTVGSAIDLAFDFEPSVLGTVDGKSELPITSFELFETPKLDEIREAFPKQALAAGEKAGHVKLTCDIAPDGRLVNCMANCEVPRDLGVADAAIGLATRYRVQTWTRSGQPLPSNKIILPIQFDAP
jgi:TonB family protein